MTQPEHLNILLVEDDEDDVLLTRTVLEEIGEPRYVLDWVNSPRAALDAVACQQYDLLLIDYSLGASSGLDLLRDLMRQGYRTPAIMLTGQGDRSLDLEAMHVGAADYLVKGQISGPLLERSLRYAWERSRAWEALRESEERHRLLAELTSDYAYSLSIPQDGTRVLDWINDAFIRLTGHTLQDLRTMDGRNRLFYSDDLPIVTRRMETLLKGDPAITIFRIVTKHGEVRWVRDYARPVWDEQQRRFVRIYGAAQDITASKQADDQIRFQARLLETVQQAVIATDLAGAITYWNAYAETLYGWPAAQALGRKIVEVLPSPFSPEEAAAIMARIAAGESRSGEILLQRRDGSSFPAHVTSSPIHDEHGTPIGIVGISFDMTDRKQAEEALAAERDLLHTLMDSMPDHIYFKDRQSRFIRINRAQAAHLGVAVAEEATGRTDLDFYPAALAAELYAQEQAIMESSRPLINQVEDVSGHANRPRWFLTTKVPIAHDGQITGLVGITRDITEIHLAEQRAVAAERFSRATLDALDEQIAILDADGTVLAVNTAWRRFARENGWHAQDPGVGSNYLAVCAVAHEETARQAADGIRAVMSGQLDSYAQEYPCHAPDRERWFALRVTRFSEEPMRVVAAHLDITARVQAEQALRHAHAELEARVVARTAELAEANRALLAATLEADTANRAKSDFLSRMSHELRTPLNAILGFAQILRMRDLGERDNQGLDYILKAGRHLLGLIDEVLDVARIDVGRLALALEPVDLGLSVREVLQLTAPLAAQRTIELVNELGESQEFHVRADRQRLTQVLLNLVSNAIKYNRAGGRVTLRCGTQEHGWLCLQVRDTGAGLGQEDVAKLFRPFERLGAAHTEVEGTGMGLALCKRLVELMGGTIGVESVVGEGTTFWFALPPADGPVNYASIRHDAITLSPVPSLRRQCTVLYIEDNASNLALIRHLLGEVADVRLLTAMQGRLGLELAQGQRPDLILLDLHLPDITGEEVLHRLRADIRTRGIPVAILSADALPGTIERLREAGAAAYLTKPIDVLQLLNFLHNILTPERSRQHGA